MSFLGTIAQSWHQNVAPALGGVMSHIAQNAVPATEVLTRNAHGVAVNHVAPAVQDAMAHIGKNSGPAVKVLVRKAHGVAINHVAPALQGAMAHIAENAGPAVFAAMKHAQEASAHLGENTQIVLYDKVAPYVVEKMAGEFDRFSDQVMQDAMLLLIKINMEMFPVLSEAQEFGGAVIEKTAALYKSLQTITLEDYTTWAYNNHLLMMGIVIALSTLIVLSGGLGTTLAMKGIQAVGFGGEGVTVNTLASLVHGKIGNVAKNSIFSTLQSAGAGGGMGAAAVDAVISKAIGVGLASTIAPIIINLLLGNEDSK